MGTINNSFAKYNVTIKKLFDAILKLNEAQQTQVMSYVEGLLLANKRISIRKACDIPINYATKNRLCSDKITDISQNGLFIETSQRLNVGKNITLSFKMQGYERPFKIEGKIVHSNHRGIGVKFSEIKPYIAQMLGALIERIKGGNGHTNQQGISINLREVKHYVAEALSVLSNRIRSQN